MLFVAIDRVRPGDRVARPIFDGRATPLVASGTSLSSFEIQRLRSLGFQGVYVHKSPERDEALGTLISHSTRAAAVEHLSDTFSTLQQGGKLAAAPLQKSVDEMIDSVLGETVVLSGLTDLRTHDNYTFEHSVNVAALALALGSGLGLDVARLRVLGLGALLHDIGKTSLSPTILRKADSLTNIEYRNVQQHARLGYDILRAYKELDPAVARIAYEHHERLDGKGYPRRLRAPAIDPLSKIVTVADVFDALTSDRVYRKGVPTSRVLDMMRSEVGVAFDADVIGCLVRRVAPYPIGTVVRLNTGEIGTVVTVPSDAPNRPSVRARVGQDGLPLDTPLLYHLRLDDSLHIEDIIGG